MRYLVLFSLLVTFVSNSAEHIDDHYYQTHSINALTGNDGYSFIVLGDWGRNGHFYQKPVAKWMDIASYQLDAEFIATTGDNFYDNGIASVSDPYWQTSFEDIYHQPHLFIDWHPVLGNHDYRGNWQAQIDYSNVSRRWEMPSQYYAKNIALGNENALLLFIDTSPLNPDYANEPKYLAAYTQGSQTQLLWIEEQLKSSNAKWKIVIGHHPLYSSGKRYGKTDAIRGVLEPLLEKYDVDAYIAGHEHDLQHNQIQGSDLIHIVSGGGSEVRPVSTYPFTKFAKSTGGFVAVTLSDTSVLFRFIDHNGNLIYTHEAQ
ncbi:tartrate-resistant acid phosphatase type 5 family protein [Alteromonas sp. KUL49]|uniref:purple acid phosphatase family protein n=1 Tax=Alteromonas sp. KUL49 TaxID=2480798 RepID=UPI00102EDDBA|nr:tartrate-resistant acid phosphatase type 5 family protein [Alteromonas sp. KUL49]TAP40173.1 acid phosphatase [Alteromonas sp. KUL49]GEA11295.1 acid phosphatase [Alteromonas sp. KUL49]